MVTIKNILNSIKNLTSKVTNLQTPIRTVLFDNSENTSKTIQLTESAYNYSYLFVKNAENYNAIIPIYSNEQENLRGIGGFSGSSNTGSTHFYGSLTNEGNTINVDYFLSIAHNSSGNHSASTSRDVLMVVGIR